MKLTYRPIDTWPGELTAHRKPSPFDASWTATQDLLEREIHHLQKRRQSTGVVIQLAVPAGAIRQDGGLASGRKAPDHPGVIISFDTPNGPMRFSCDRFDTAYWRPTLDAWQVNVRAIALGMEALRKVERYGLGTGTEQYVGFQALGSGRPMGGVETMTIEEAARILIAEADAGFIILPEVIGNTETVTRLYRLASKRLHPDVGGDAEAFKRITQARDLLTGSR